MIGNCIGVIGKYESFEAVGEGWVSGMTAVVAGYVRARSKSRSKEEGVERFVSPGMGPFERSGAGEEILYGVGLCVEVRREDWRFCECHGVSGSGRTLIISLFA